MKRFTAVSCLLAACAGGGGGELPDGQPMADAAPDGAPVGSVHVTARARCCEAPPDSPVAGAAVHVLRPDRSLATTVVTGADGTAIVDGVVAGSAVMVVYPEGHSSSDHVTTILGVEPGDELVLGDGHSWGPGPSGEYRAITIDYPPTVATTVQASFPCAAAAQLGPSPSEAMFPVECPTSGVTIPLFAYDDSYTILGSAVLRDVELASGGSFAVPSWSPPVEQVVRATVAPSVGWGSFELDWRYPGITSGASREAWIANGTASATFSSPAGADAVVATAVLERTELGWQEHRHTFGPKSTLMEIPIVELPWLGPEITSFDDQHVRWLQDGDGGDAVVATIYYQPADEATGGERTIAWTIVAPPGASELAWADFPTELPAPRPGDGHQQTLLDIIDLGSASTYAELRAAPEWHLTCPSCAIGLGAQSAMAIASHPDAF